MPFTCSICEEESTRICAQCTKDTCSNHLCEKCGCCSDCCECDVPLDEPLAAAPAVHSEAPAPVAEPPVVHAEPPPSDPEREPEPPHPPPDPDPLPEPEDEPEPGAPV